MKQKKSFIHFTLLVLLSFLLGSKSAMAQSQSIGENDTILLGGIVIGNDTLPVAFLKDVNIYGKMDPKRAAELRTLRYHVTKVYPYAITAAYILQKVDAELDVKNKKKDRKQYIKAMEKEMNAQFKDELKNLSITQGQILVKLINRQTGREVYDILKELKGGLNARIYQTTAFFFKNNLKKQYDPYGEDRDIEMIVQEIESKIYSNTQKLPQVSPKKLSN